MVLVNDKFRIQIGIGDVTFHTVPFTVLCYFSFTDGDLCVIANLKKLIIPSFVYLLFCDVPTFIGFPQTGYASVTIIGVLLCTFFGIADNKSFFILSLIFMINLVFLLQRQYPLLNTRALTLNEYSENILVASLLQ